MLKVRNLTMERNKGELSSEMRTKQWQWLISFSFSFVDDGDRMAEPGNIFKLAFASVANV